MALAMLCAFNSRLSTVRAQGTAFTYQGQLANNGLPANGSFDLTFTLFATNSAGSPFAGPVTNSATAVSNGLFTVIIDFGAGVFTGGGNWLEIGVRTNGAGGFTTLAPRQQITPTPYAITAGRVTGAIPLAQLPAALVTNGASGVNFSGTFSGNGSGLTNLAAAIAAVNGVGANTTLTNASVSATNFFLGGLSPNFLYVQSNVLGEIIDGESTETGVPVFANFVPNGNPNYNDCLIVACDDTLTNTYGDIAFGYYGYGDDTSPGNFQTQAGIGISSIGGNWNTPWLNQSNYGIYQEGSFVLCVVGGNPVVFAGNILGNPKGDIPEMFLSHNYTDFMITDQWTGSTNYFDFNKINASFYVPYGAVITPNIYATNVTAGTFTGNGAGLTNIPFSGIQSNGGVYFPSNTFTIAQITNGLSEGGGWIGMISNIMWAYKLSNGIVVSNQLN